MLPGTVPRHRPAPRRGAARPGSPHAGAPPHGAHRGRHLRARRGVGRPQAGAAGGAQVCPRRGGRAAAGRPPIPGADAQARPRARVQCVCTRAGLARPRCRFKSAPCRGAGAACRFPRLPFVLHASACPLQSRRAAYLVAKGLLPGLTGPQTPQPPPPLRRQLLEAQQQREDALRGLGACAGRGLLALPDGGAGLAPVGASAGEGGQGPEAAASDVRAPRDMGPMEEGSGCWPAAGWYLAGLVRRFWAGGPRVLFDRPPPIVGLSPVWGRPRGARSTRANPARRPPRGPSCARRPLPFPHPPRAPFRRAATHLWGFRRRP